MSEYMILFLLIALLVAVSYIFWLHLEKDKRKQKPILHRPMQSKESVEGEPDLDEMSFLKSQYGYDLTKGDDEIMEEVAQN